MMEVSPLAEPFPEMPAIPGVTLRVACAGYKDWGRCDLTYVELAEGTAVAGVFTRNVCCSSEVELGRELWSECGQERDLNVKTLIRLKNGEPKGTGYVNLAAVTGSAKAVVRVSWRRCQDDKPVAPPTAPGGPTIVGGSRDENPTSTPGSAGPTVTPQPRDNTPTAPTSGPGISVERT